MRHIAALEPTSTGRRAPELRNMWQRRSSPLVEAEAEAMGHVVTPEPTSTGRRCLKLRNTWQCWSSTQQGGEARGHGTRGSTGAHLGRKTRSEAAGHVEVSELTSIGRRGPELQGTWQRVDARPITCLDLKLICGGTRSAGYRQLSLVC
jgi:hypothetical protein